MPYHKPAQVNQVFCYPLIKYNGRFILLVYRYIRSFPCPIRTPGTGYVETCLQNAMTQLEWKTIKWSKKVIRNIYTCKSKSKKKWYKNRLIGRKLVGCFQLWLRRGSLLRTFDTFFSPLIPEVYRRVRRDALVWSEGDRSSAEVRSHSKNLFAFRAGHYKDLTEMSNRTESLALTVYKTT